MSKSEETAKDLLCDRCGKPVGSTWVTTPSYEILCLSCWVKGEGKVAG